MSDRAGIAVHQQAAHGHDPIRSIQEIDVAREESELHQRLGRQRISRGERVVHLVLLAHDQLFRIVTHGEHRPTFGIGEQVDEPSDQALSLGVPADLAGGLVEGEQPQCHRGMVFEETGDTRPSVGPSAQQAPVFAHEVLEDERGTPPGIFEVPVITQDRSCFCECPDGESVPRRDHLVVEAWGNPLRSGAGKLSSARSTRARRCLDRHPAFRLPLRR